MRASVIGLTASARLTATTPFFDKAPPSATQAPACPRTAAPPSTTAHSPMTSSLARRIYGTRFCRFCAARWSMRGRFDAYVYEWLPPLIGGADKAPVFDAGRMIPVRFTVRSSDGTRVRDDR